MLPPLGRFLVAGEGTYEGGVNIPDLPKRLHELPPSTSQLQVAGDQAEDVASWLRLSGRNVSILRESPIAVETPMRPRWRLWDPNPFLSQALTGARVGTAIDLGCGSGRDSVYLASTGWEVTGLDILPDAIERAKDLEVRYGSGGSIQWVIGDASSLPTTAYDLVVMLRFYHPEVLAAATKMLSDGGLIVIQSFAEEFSVRTGKPSNPLFVFHAAHVPDTLRIVHYEVDDQWQRVVLVR